MRREQWLGARLNCSPNELPWFGGTTHFCDLLGPWEHLSSSSFNEITFKIPQRSSYLLLEAGQEPTSFAGLVLCSLYTIILTFFFYF